MGFSFEESSAPRISTKLSSRVAAAANPFSFTWTPFDLCQHPARGANMTRQEDCFLSCPNLIYWRRKEISGIVIMGLNPHPKKVKCFVGKIWCFFLFLTVNKNLLRIAKMSCLFIFFNIIKIEFFQINKFEEYYIIKLVHYLNSNCQRSLFNDPSCFRSGLQILETGMVKFGRMLHLTRSLMMLVMVGGLKDLVVHFCFLNWKILKSGWLSGGSLELIVPFKA